MKSPKTPPPIYEAPLTAEARERLIRELFADDMPHFDELFVPDDLFYVGGKPDHQMNVMLERLAEWSGVKPGYIHLLVEGTTNSAVAAARYTASIDQQVLHNEFRLGGTIARAITRFLIEDRKQIHLAHPADQDMLLASASVLFGFGIVIQNALIPKIMGLKVDRVDSHIHQQLLGTVPIQQFNRLVHGFLIRQYHNQAHYDYSLTPWAAQRLNTSAPKRTSHAVKLAKHQYRTATIKVLGVGWAVGLVVIVIIFVSLQHTTPINQTKLEADRQAASLSIDAKQCQDALSYERQYTDTTDIQAVRKLEADAQRCQSLQNQADAASQYARSLQP